MLVVLYNGRKTAVAVVFCLFCAWRLQFFVDTQHAGGMDRHWTGRILHIVIDTGAVLLISLRIYLL